MTSMLSQAFLDESGGLDHPRLVLGGYVGNLDLWTAFSEDWRKVLDKHGLPPLHMRMLRNKAQGGKWAVLCDEEQHAILLELIGVIATHKPQSFVSMVGIPDFVRRMPQHDSRLSWTYPYSFAACNVVGGITDLEDVCGREFGSVEVVFDWLQQFNRSVGWTIEERVRAHLASRANRLGRVSWAGVANRDRFVPLQAADMLVWHERRTSDHRIPLLQKILSNRRLEALRKASPPKYLGTNRETVPGHRDLLDIWLEGWSGREDPQPPPTYSPIC